MENVNEVYVGTDKENAEVSPEKAAEMLRISRPTLLKKLDSGEIPFHYVGSHRRIAVADVLATGANRKSVLRRRCGKCAMRPTNWGFMNREAECQPLWFFVTPTSSTRSFGRSAGAKARRPGTMR
jgi:excisionase family DNA binding protein